MATEFTKTNIERDAIPAVERRYVPTEMHIRMDGEGDEKKGVLEGYTAKFNKRTLLYLWSDEEWWEEILPGAFDDVLGDDVRCLKNHDANYVLGRNKAGTLKLNVDATGLRFECVPDTRITYAADTVHAVERGDISQCSFAFTIAKQSWEEQSRDGKLIITRKIEKIKRLYDVGPVTYPAYEDTTVEYNGKTGIRAASPDDYRAGLEAWRSEHRAAEATSENEQIQKQPSIEHRRRRLRLLELES